MKLKQILGWSSALCLCATIAQAQETNGVEQLKQQLRQMQENFEKAQRDQKEKIEALTQRLDELTKQQAAAELQPDRTNAPSSATTQSWSPTQPLTVARAGSAYMNISFDAMMAAGGSTVSDPSAQLELGDHDPIKNGFSLRNAEIAVDGAVDPYFKGFANIVSSSIKIIRPTSNWRKLMRNPPRCRPIYRRRPASFLPRSGARTRSTRTSGHSWMRPSF